MAAQHAKWTVIIPVKHLAQAKSRLAATSDVAVDELALAFFADTASAVLATESVGALVVATSDPRASRWTIEHGGRVVDDTGQLGINAAASAAAIGGGPHLAVMVSDLPCATPDALEVALAGCPRNGTAIVADADGTGTTMWMGPASRLADLSFGPHSRTLHIATGALDLVDHGDDAALLAPIRRDVDTEIDLDDAVSMGVGPATARVLHHRRRTGAAPFGTTKPPATG